MSQVFLSYAREDRQNAEALAGVLARRGWSVWWDRSILPGSSFEEEIERHIEEARVVVVLWSRAAAASAWVRNEAAEGMARGILVPARLDDAFAAGLTYPSAPREAAYLIGAAMVGVSALAVWARRYRPLWAGLIAVELELLGLAVLFAAGITLERGALPWAEWPDLVAHFWPVLLRGGISLALLAGVAQWLTTRSIGRRGMER